LPEGGEGRGEGRQMDRFGPERTPTSMNAMLLVSLVTLGQLQLTDGDKQLRLSLSEGLVLKNGSKQVVLSGAGAVGKVDGGTAFTGVAQSKTHACTDGEDIDVGGTNNQISLTGKCGK